MSRQAPEAAGWAPAAVSRPHTFRAALIVVLAVAVTVGLLTQVGAHRARSAAKVVAGGSTGGSVAGSSGSLANNNTTTTTTTPVVAPSQIRLQVLNGLIAGTLSAQWSTKLHANPGYITLPPDNTTSEDPISAIYIVKLGYQAEASALAKAVGLPASSIVVEVPPPSSAPIPSVDLQQADLVLVVGQSLASRA